MSPHRLYKLDYGVPVGHTIVGLVAASGSFELFKLGLDERLAFPLCALTGAATFLAWLWLKRKLPRNAVPDLIDWLLQPAVYRATRDTRTTPLVVELERGEDRDAARRLAH